MAIVEVYPNPFSTTTSSPSFCSYHHHNPNPFFTTTTTTSSPSFCSYHHHNPNPFSTSRPIPFTPPHLLLTTRPIPTPPHLLLATRAYSSPREIRRQDGYH